MDGGTMCGNLYEFCECLVDENERDEDGEDFLGEAGNESNQEASFHRHNDDYNHDQPYTHPDPAHNVLQTLSLAELILKEQKRKYLGKLYFFKT